MTAGHGVGDRIGPGRHGGRSGGGSNLGRLHLELGGKAPVIVFDDADPAAAAEGIGVPATSTPARIAPPPRGPGGRVHDALLAALIEQAEATTVGGTTTSRPIGSSTRPRSSTGSAASSSAPPPTRRPDRRGPGGRPRLLLRVDRRHRAASGRRDGAIRGVGPVITVQEFSDEAEALSGPTGSSTGLRPRRGTVITAGPCAWPRSRFRLRADQHAHPAGGRAATRRIQAFRVRQGPLGVRI